MGTVLVTGGAGYIGSVFVETLRKTGDKVVVLDNLFRGHSQAVPADVPFYQGDIGDENLLDEICRVHKPDACVHFAALAYVGESVKEPFNYYQNNFSKAVVLFRNLLKHGVKHIVFSSSCATYGEPQQMPIPETHPQWPVNPYGWSKLFVEQALTAFETAHGLRFVALRYFNAAGDTPTRGEHHDPETHLIPLVLQVALGQRPAISIFGTDYPTPDGTAIRDYIHVLDLADAHVRALHHLRKGGKSEFINLGTGRGYSVKQVIAEAEKVTGRKIATKLEPRRPGDPPELVADASKAQQVLGWTPKHSDMKEVLTSAWEWHKAHPKGYEKK
jgi:UDP-glucose 4-epimerase